MDYTLSYDRGGLVAASVSLSGFLLLLMHLHSIKLWSNNLTFIAFLHNFSLMLNIEWVLNHSCKITSEVSKFMVSAIDWCSQPWLTTRNNGKRFGWN